MMQIALYRAAASTGSWAWLDSAINRLSGGRGYSHVELVMSDGWCLSSTVRDEGMDASGERKPNGTRAKMIQFDPGKWQFIALPDATREDEAAIWREFHTREILNARYDFRGVARFVFPLIPQDPDDYFCSEIVTELLQSRGLFPSREQPHRVSPNTIAELYGIA